MNTETFSLYCENGRWHFFDDGKKVLLPAEIRTETEVSEWAAEFWPGKTISFITDAVGGLPTPKPTDWPAMPANREDEPDEDEDDFDDDFDDDFEDDDGESWKNK